MRFAAYLDIFYELLGSRPLKIEARLKDISREGLRLSGENALLKGSYIDMEIVIPGEDRYILAFCEVVWCKKLGNVYYETGMRFTKIQRHDKARLLDYVYNEWLKIQKPAPASAI